MTARIQIGMDGNAGFALLGDNIQEGQCEFVTTPEPDGERSLFQRECWAATQAYRKLSARTGVRSYYLDPSHPRYI